MCINQGNKLPPSRHPREGGDPGSLIKKDWIPAFAGMTQLIMSFYLSCRKFKVFLILVITLILALFFSYHKALSAPFIMDDLHHIYYNYKIRDISNLGDVLFCGVQETRPLYNLSLAINSHFFGINPFSFRLINLIIHLVNSILLLFLLRVVIAKNTTIRADFLIILTTLLFSISPIQTESITYVNSRSGLLSAFFILLSLNLYFYSLKPRAIFYISMLTILAIMCKENGVIVPFLILAIDYFIVKDRREFFSRKYYLKNLSIFLSLLTLPLLYLIFSTPHENTIGFHVGSIFNQIYTQTKVWIYIIGITIFPFWQNLDYDVTRETTLLSPYVIISMLLLVLILVKTVNYRNKSNIPLLCLSWFAISIFPTNSFIPFVDFICERHFYLASIGLYFLFSFVLIRTFLNLKISNKKQSILIYFVGFIICSTYLYLTYQRNLLYTNEVSIWRDTAKKSKNKYRPHYNLGVALLNKREYQEAILEFKVANKIAKNKEVEAILGLTGAFIKTREFDSALNYLQNRININVENSELIREMAYIYLLKGDILIAEKYFDKISSKMGNSVSYLSQYGYLLNLKGDLTESLNYYSKAINIDPYNSNLYNNRAIIYLRLNLFSQAIDDLNKALSINPNDTDALYNMGFYHESVDNNIEKAIEYYKKALIIDKNYKSARERLKIIQN